MLMIMTSCDPQLRPLSSYCDVIVVIARHHRHWERVSTRDEWDVRGETRGAKARVTSAVLCLCACLVHDSVSFNLKQASP